MCKFSKPLLLLFLPPAAHFLELQGDSNLSSAPYQLWVCRQVTFTPLVSISSSEPENNNLHLSGLL